MTSKLDYLKKYMDGGEADKSKDKRKKKRVKKKPLSNIKIIDAQATFSTGKDEDTEEFDLMEEKPIMYAEDGATIFTKEYEEQEKKKKSSWKTLESERKKRHDSSGSEDLSPVRQIRRKRHDSNDSDLSPPRSRHAANASGSDISPPRKRRQRHDSSASSDLSPERPRRQKSDYDFSPQRNRNASDSDLSPNRNSKKDTSTRKNRKEEIPEVVSIGKKAGLQSASDLKKENELRRKQEREKFKNLDQSISGKGAETVYRDRKSGKKIDVKFEELQKRKAEEQRVKETEKYAVWGRGVAQEKENKQKLEDALHEISKPLARYKDDKDLDALLKEKDREGDPMLAYMAKKKNKVESNKLSKPKYKGSNPPPNRFNIWPGYRFDGVDRSNGFEKQRFAAINKMKTFNEAKHKWSVEDM